MQFLRSLFYGFLWYFHFCVLLTFAAFHPSSILDHIVVKRVYHKFEAQDWLNCLTACLADERCSSYNFQLHSYKKSGLTCELSQCGMDDTREKSLIAKTGFVFHQVRHEKVSCTVKKQAEPTLKPITASGLEKSMILQGRPVEYMATLDDYLKPAAIGQLWTRCFHSSPGLDAAAFHMSCDSKGPTVTIVRVGKYIFGGFIDKSWRSGGRQPNCPAVRTNQAFLFSLYNNDGFKPKKFPVLSSSVVAAYHCSDMGPTFGRGFDLALYGGKHAGQSYARCKSYEEPPGCKTGQLEQSTFYTGTAAFLPNEVEVFYLC